MGLGGPILRLEDRRGCLDVIVFLEIISIPLEKPGCLALCAARIDAVDSPASSPSLFILAVFIDAAASFDGLLVLKTCDGLRFKLFFVEIFLAYLREEIVAFYSSISLSINFMCYELVPMIFSFKLSIV